MHRRRRREREGEAEEGKARRIRKASSIVTCRAAAVMGSWAGLDQLAS